ncbi:hypothetical protein PR002_g21168 [Phytophthora rubi]|uniref:BZIP domain-containing protein n=1 Tax=Phytophthora rubi TaxID=129364 RepID=A0A6A3JAF7_9STRA|nr:hypothetical protein PR002_g21168 [Phytophthora rubi]
MQMATPKHASNLHAPAEAAALGLTPSLWSADDQALLDILLMTEPSDDASAAVKELEMQQQQQQDVQMYTSSPSSPQVQQEVQPASPVAAPCSKHTAKDSPKGKLSAIERRARHREVVKRAYHRNKAALKSLRDTVKGLEQQLEKLSLSKPHAQPKSSAADEIQRRYALLTHEQEELGSEAARLRLLLHYRQQFATNMVAMAQRAASISSDESDNSDTDSDTATTSSSSSATFPSPPLYLGADSSPLPTQDTNARGVSPLSASHKKSSTQFFNEPRPTFVGPTITGKTPLALAMRKQLGYRPLGFTESAALVNEFYRCILDFSLSGRALTTGASIMGWEDKRLLDGTTLNFSLRKRFAGRSAMELMTSTWQCFSDPECTETKFRGLMTLRILQRVNDDTIVALRESTSPDGAKLYRCVYLLFRVRTRKGFVICVKSVSPERLTDPALSSISRDGRAVQWTELSGWFVFEPIVEAGGEAGFYQEGAQVEYGGCMDYGDNESIAELAMNTLSIVLNKPVQTSVGATGGRFASSPVSLGVGREL